jgi:hypothetical protein
MSSELKRKPLWLRLRQRYHNWRQRALIRIGICQNCGWRWAGGEHCCNRCYWELLGGY